MKKIFFVLGCLTLNLTFGQIEKIEPEFWWSGMKYSTIQVLFYGEDIASLEPSSEEIPVMEVTRTENPNYLFVTLDTRDLMPGEYKIEFGKKRGRPLIVNYVLKERKKGSADRIGFDASDMIYLIMPDRFANGDPSNDTVKELKEKGDRANPGGRHGGDIRGVINNLDYIKELGATALWSTPLCEDDDEHYSYHTYAQSDLYKIDPRYGTNEDYRELASELHKKDMKLIMDYVTNHWGMEHWLIQDLPDYNWIHQFPGYAQSNYRMTTQMDPNASEWDKRYCMDGWFVPTMPDLNQSNPLVLNYITQNAIWWIEYADLDGFRVDTYSYNDRNGIATWTKAIMDEYPNFNIVGEVWMHDQSQMAFWQKDSKLAEIQNYNSYLPSVMDFTLHDAIESAFNVEEPAWNRGMIQVYENFTNDYLYPDINNILVFAENHDTQRINERYPDLKNYKLIMTLLATVRGIPQLYYGSEIGMQGDKGKGDADIRRDFPGGWKGDTNNAFLKEGRTSEQQAYFDFTSKLFNWRKNATAIHNGKTVHFLPVNDVYVFFRFNGTQKIMVVINNNTDEVTLDLLRYKEQLDAVNTGINILEGETVPLEGQLSIEGKSSMIIDLQI
ncbi:glycoside hydrolase family 13 protein [Robertkochia solimangrovi]|uniref:glycoside hydrolase family 13 protein n=1 Tax=Robertkochia solimangrovi TaxID=2213046 RepID=UPI00117F8493|nr:glycoside hydrolase family 13 protein [Robertkochia solimangrovi]TRZ43295.1 alpha-amlyase [Robertkochia solimangrovi]